MGPVTWRVQIHTAFKMKNFNWKYQGAVGRVLISCFNNDYFLFLEDCGRLFLMLILHFFPWVWYDGFFIFLTIFIFQIMKNEFGDIWNTRTRSFSVREPKDAWRGNKISKPKIFISHRNEIHVLKLWFVILIVNPSCSFF